jgi:hypothetical protein
MERSAENRHSKRTGVSGKIFGSHLVNHDVVQAQSLRSSSRLRDHVRIGINREDISKILRHNLEHLSGTASGIEQPPTAIQTGSLHHIIHDRLWIDTPIRRVVLGRTAIKVTDTTANLKTLPLVSLGHFVPFPGSLSRNRSVRRTAVDMLAPYDRRSGAW